ncbi:MAG: small EDRK-rich factor 1-like protein [Piptocephalis tieghemiana]|nr:MAG: small EDRK-rich factor 1-like protein [Piptocephalis tieghemiana]
MARGNQRDLAREKNLKKQKEQNKGRKDDGMTLLQRREADAARMREKQKAAEEARAAKAGGGKK